MRALATSSLLLGACGASSSPLTRDESIRAGQALAMAVEESGQLFGPLMGDVGSGAPCTMRSGDAGDSDLDSIPTEAVLDCSWQTAALGYTGTLLGTFDVKDEAPAARAWSFTAQVEAHETLASPAGGTIRRQWGGLIASSQDNGFSAHRVLRVISAFPAVGPSPEMTVTEDSDWLVTYEPATPWASGDAIVAGVLDVSGTWDVGIGDTSASASLETLSALIVEPTCPTRITSGEVVGRYVNDDRMNSIIVTWTSCGTSTVSSTSSFAF